MLLEKLNEAIKVAMRAKEALKRDTLRAVVSDIKLSSKELKRDLDQNEQLAILNRHVKQIKESIEAYTAGQRLDLVALEEEKLLVLTVFLPKQLSSDEIKDMIEKEINAQSLDCSNKGLLMKHLMPLFKGRADGKLVSQIIASYAK